MLFRFTLFLLLICSFTSCKIVSYSFTGISVDPSVKTLSIQTLSNTAGNIPPDLVQTFTENMKDKFSQEARLDLVPQNGDVFFSGAITDYNVRPAASSGDDRAERNRLTVSLRIDYVNVVEDKNWSQSFTHFEDFDRNTNLADAEDQLIPTIMERLITDVFNKAFSDW